MGRFKYEIIKNRTTMKQLLILFALFPVLLIGQNLPQKTSIEVLSNPSRIVSTMHHKGESWTDTVKVDDHALQDSVKKWEKDDRIYAVRTLPVDPEMSKTTYIYRDIINKPWIDKRKFQIKGEHPIRITELDNGMIRIEKRESEAEFWKRKYHELLKSHLELIERQ